jgi:hypothetical protein
VGENHETTRTISRFGEFQVGLEALAAGGNLNRSFGWLGIVVHLDSRLPPERGEDRVVGHGREIAIPVRHHAERFGALALAGGAP